MGDHITPRQTSADPRPRVLSSPAEITAAASEPIIPSFATDSPELQRAYLEQLVECAPEAITILDPECRIARLNGEFTRIFGFGPAEALGQRIDSLIVRSEEHTS